MNYINPEQFIDDICVQNHILQRICIELTYRCNERCKHCYVFDEKKSTDGELTTDQYLKLFDELRIMETLHITFTGGDPSQRRDFTHILRGAVERDFAVTIFTNGEALRRLYEVRFNQLGESCLNCLYRNDCLYCLGSALAENGNIFVSVKEGCKIAKATYELRLSK